MAKRACLILLLTLTCLSSGGGFLSSVGAGEPPVTVYLFWTTGCHHCAHEKEFLSAMASRDPGIKVMSLNLSDSRENLELFQKVGELLHTNVPGVPFTVIGHYYVVGWQDAATTGRTIETAIREVRSRGVPDVVAGLRTPQPSPVIPPRVAIPETLTLPIIGPVHLKYLSLGLITVIIGALDGFNPCAMWVLIFLINLLLGLEDRKQMWVLGTAFIIASGAVYFLLMTAWLNVLVFLGLIFWVRLAIGGVALFAGGYNLKEYFRGTAGVCKLSHGARRQWTMDRLQGFIATGKFWLALGGIILLAFLVNLVELICSTGFSGGLPANPESDPHALLAVLSLYAALYFHFHAG
jgi:thiol-disulfide isomerase/thioredoxin